MKFIGDHLKLVLALRKPNHNLNTHEGMLMNHATCFYTALLNPQPKPLKAAKQHLCGHGFQPSLSASLRTPF